MRFSPPTAGSWVYRTESPSLPALDGLRGKFSVLPAPQAERGPVRAAGSHFEHTDRTKHITYTLLALALSLSLSLTLTLTLTLAFTRTLTLTLTRSSAS